ncbi:hypothetical protein [Amnibacterium setariae]|uniref:Uncharacterized protein n=1 Tax=Amnibacterium setariae TaxID=2306585 RepID=A0A3A1TW27_9MICO|nr:hypothetical protein [Amnibacterium setariae]RIX27751.1 hypothetical protein D1781_09400 [Amnibacterium setariae]
MSMSDPFLPVPPEPEDDRAEQEVEDVEDDSEPDVLTGPADEESGEEARDAGAFRAFEPGERLSAEDLERDLD